MLCQVQARQRNGRIPARSWSQPSKKLFDKCSCRSLQEEIAVLQRLASCLTAGSCLQDLSTLTQKLAPPDLKSFISMRCSFAKDNQLHCNTFQYYIYIIIYTHLHYINTCMTCIFVYSFIHSFIQLISWFIYLYVYNHTYLYTQYLKLRATRQCWQKLVNRSKVIFSCRSWRTRAARSGDFKCRSNKLPKNWSPAISKLIPWKWYKPNNEPMAHSGKLFL